MSPTGSSVAAGGTRACWLSHKLGAQPGVRSDSERGGVLAGGSWKAALGLTETAPAQARAPQNQSRRGVPASGGHSGYRSQEAQGLGGPGRRAARHSQRLRVLNVLRTDSCRQSWGDVAGTQSPPGTPNPPAPSPSTHQQQGVPFLPGLP